ncbi:MAG: hypothetical protein MJ225_04410 [Bacilli bacterium]|nr:hypothetical protein [Bacilli bacterium]
MKVKELIKLLSQYDDDFRVELVTDNYPYKWYKIVGVADVGYSAKEIVLDIEEI